MRWSSSPSVLTALLMTLACSGERDAAAELREFAALERALNAVSDSPPQDKALRLDELEQVEVASPAVGRVKQRCAAAYRAFLMAAEQMEVARREVGRIEAEANRALSGPVDLDASAGKLSAMHEKAVAATAELNAALDRAEALVGECTELRTELARRLGAE